MVQGPHPAVQVGQGFDLHDELTQTLGTVGRSIQTNRNYVLAEVTLMDGSKQRIWVISGGTKHVNNFEIAISPHIGSDEVATFSNADMFRDRMVYRYGGERPVSAYELMEHASDEIEDLGGIRFRDSEPQLFEYIARTYNREDLDSIRFLTTRHPCESCGGYLWDELGNVKKLGNQGIISFYHDYFASVSIYPYYIFK